MAVCTRIHLGSGYYYWPGFTNVDRHGDPDVISDVDNLSMFGSESVDEIHAIHLFEHLHRTKEAEQALREWYRVLKPGGKLILEMPCLDKMVSLIVNGEKNKRLTLFGLFGDPREEKPDMEHKWAWSIQELGDTLSKYNFTEIKFYEPAFHLPARDMRVCSIKSSG